MASLTIDALLELWSANVRANNLAPGTARRYKSAIECFFDCYEQVEQRRLTLEQLSSVILIRYCNFLQRTQKCATGTVNVYVSALPVWWAWMTFERYLVSNPAKRIKLVGRQEASSHKRLEPTQINALLRQVRTSREGVCNYMIWQILFHTWMRLDKCSHPNLENIEIGERSGCVTIRQDKEEKVRTVPLNASERQTLTEYISPRSASDPTTKVVALAWHISNTKPSLLWLDWKCNHLISLAIPEIINAVVHDATAPGLILTNASAHTFRCNFARNHLADYLVMLLCWRLYWDITHSILREFIANLL